MPIDFNPQPQPNAIDALQGGLQRGLGLGLTAQQLQMNNLAIQQARQQQEAMRQQQEAEKKKEKMQKFEKGLQFLTDSKFSKYLSNSTKTKILRDSVIPVANEQFGFDLNPADVNYSEKYDNLLNLVKNGAPWELVLAEYRNVVANADSEDLPVIKELGDTLGVGGTAGATGGPTVAKAEGAILQKYLTSGVDSLTDEEKNVFESRIIKKDPYLVQAINIVGQNLNNLGAEPQEILRQARVIADELRKAYSGESAGTGGPIKSIRKKG